MSITKKIEFKNINLRYRKKYYYYNTFDILKNQIKEDINKYSTRSILFKNFDYNNNYIFYNKNYSHDFFYNKKKTEISNFNYKIKNIKKNNFFKKVAVKKKKRN